MRYRHSRRRRAGIALAGVAVAVAIGGASVGLPVEDGTGSAAPSPFVLEGGVVQAHTLPGDQLLAGPALLHHRAIWVEAGRRLLVRSLDAHGRTRTIFSTSKTPGAPRGALWPYSVRGIAAGDGRVAFVESVTPCASAPPRLSRCTPYPGEETSPYSVTLFAGRPAAIRPVTSAMHTGCSRRQVPQEVEIARGGLLVEEMADPCGARAPVLRLALRSFAGGLEHALARGEESKLPLVAGSFALIRSEYGAPGPMKLVRLSTGKTVLTLPQRCWLRFTDGSALDSSGEFALLSDSDGPRQRACQQQRGSVLRVGRIGSSDLRTVATHVRESTRISSIGIADGYVAFERQTGRSARHVEVVVAAPGRRPTPIAGMKAGALAFDGRVVTTVHDDTVQLAVLRRR